MAKKPRKSAKKSVKSRAKTSARKPAKKSAARKTAPKGHALMAVTPGFTANDAAASIKWYCDVLGFTVIERWEHEGQFLGAQIGSGAVTMNIGQDDWKMGRGRIKGQGTRMYFMTGPEIDKIAENVQGLVALGIDGRLLCIILAADQFRVCIRGSFRRDLQRNSVFLRGG